LLDGADDSVEWGNRDQLSKSAEVKHKERPKGKELGKGLITRSEYGRGIKEIGRFVTVGGTCQWPPVNISVFFYSMCR
jgi:hypothetical protein